MDPSLKALFDKIGVSETQLQDKETANFIYDFIDQHGGIEAIKKEQSFTPQISASPMVPPPPPVGGSKYRIHSNSSPKGMGKTIL